MVEKERVEGGSELWFATVTLKLRTPQPNHGQIRYFLGHWEASLLFYNRTSRFFLNLRF